MNQVNQKYIDESDEGYYFKISETSVLDLTITVDVDKPLFLSEIIRLSPFLVRFCSLSETLEPPNICTAKLPPTMLVQ